MADKMNLFLDFDKIQIEGDEFRYQYSYDEIVYMLDLAITTVNNLTKRKNRIDEEATKVNDSLIQYQFTLEKLTTIKEALEASVEPANPSAEPTVASPE